MEVVTNWSVEKLGVVDCYDYRLKLQSVCAVKVVNNYSSKFCVGMAYKTESGPGLDA